MINYLLAKKCNGKIGQVTMQSFVCDNRLSVRLFSLIPTNCVLSKNKHRRCENKFLL